MTTRKAHYPGLDIYRAIAVLLMIAAHTARMQTDMATLHNNPSLAGIFDWPFVAILIIEPIISAMFLFIAGFSLVLSLASSHNHNAWLTRLANKMAVLYGISVLFYFADRGAQLPDLLVSSGVLGIIAVGIFSAALALKTPRPAFTLVLLFLGTSFCAFFLEQNRLDIVGLNAGAGGMIPLLSLAYLGSICGLIWQRWRNNGLWVALAVSSVIAILALQTSHHWVVHPSSSIVIYPGDRLSALGYSLQDAFGLYQGDSTQATVRYWNHSWIFSFRSAALLLLGLLISLSVVSKLENKVASYIERLGAQALNLYILHLILLAALEVSGLKPNQGWQTLCLYFLVIGLSGWLLRFVSFVPIKFYWPIRKT